MKANNSLPAAACLLVAGLLVTVSAPRAAAETPLDQIAIGRQQVKAGRTATVAEAMQFSEAEGKVFWPLYNEYRAEMDKINDGLLKLILEYADVYPNVPEERAAQMLKDYTAFERSIGNARAEYIMKVAKTLTAAKALRLAQVEIRLDMAIRLEMANAIPLVPKSAK